MDSRSTGEKAPGVDPPADLDSVAGFKELGAPGCRVRQHGLDAAAVRQLDHVYGDVAEIEKIEYAAAEVILVSFRREARPDRDLLRAQRQHPVRAGRHAVSVQRRHL